MLKSEERETILLVCEEKLRQNGANKELLPRTYSYRAGTLEIELKILRQNTFIIPLIQPIHFT